MPNLPLPPLPGGVPIDCGPLPVADEDDVSAQWSPEINESQSAPVRDAIKGGQLALALEYQKRARYAAAQSDPLRATGEYEDEIFGYERGIQRQKGESHDAYRARGLSFEGTVDPNDIIAAANAVLAPYTSISCRYAEQSDGWFLSDTATTDHGGTRIWSSHLFDAPGNAANVPSYPDRAYANDPSTLTSIPNRRPPGAMPNFDTQGRWFLLRCPDISPVDATTVPVYAGDQVASNTSGFFIGAGTAGTANISCLFDFSSTSDDVYRAVIGAVNRLVGHSMRWSLVVDKNLSA